MPDLAGLGIRDDWQDREKQLLRRSLRGWVLLASGLGLYLVVMIAARLVLPRGHGALLPVEYLLVHVFIYIPVPLLFALGARRRAALDVLPWLPAVLIPAFLAGLAKGQLLYYSGPSESFRLAVDLLRLAIYPLGIGLWVTIFFIIRWQRCCPEGLAELGLAPERPVRHLINAGAGAGAAVLLLLHLVLTLFYSGMRLPSWAGFGALWRKGCFTLAQECLGEELLYRGFFFLYLRRLNWSFWPAALLVAAFDAAHFLFVPGTLDNLARSIGFVYYVFVYSVVNCMLIDRTRSLLAPWLANALFTMSLAMLSIGAVG